MNNEKSRPISNRFTYVITFLLGLAFCITLVQSAWKTAIERKQKDFQFEIISIKQSVARNVLAGNDVTNNVAAFIYANNNIDESQFNSFADDVLKRYNHIEAINYYVFTGNNEVNAFPLVFEKSRNPNPIKTGENIYLNPKFRDAIDTSAVFGSVIPAPPDIKNDSDRKYWLFKAVHLQSPSSIKEKKYAGAIKGVVSILVSPTKLLGEKGGNSSLTITMFSDTSNLYGRQLLYFNEPNQTVENKFWQIDKFVEEELIQLPPYSIKIIIEKNLFLSDLEYHIILIAFLIGAGILMLLYGLAQARAKQEEELRLRNQLIEKKVDEQTKELAIARDQALEAVKMKSEFLASMSHEIRTPLNAIIGMSDLMSETKMSDEQSRYVSVFKKAGDALLSLVNDILDLSKIEAGQIVLEEIPFNIMELIEEVAEIYALKAADKNIEIITHIDPDVNVNRIGDPGRIKQIVLNMISNSLKFSDEGEIVISLKEPEDSEHENYLTICVKDTGIGIAKNKLESIFASFTQADASTTRKYGGTGLGLTISRKLTELMQGKIWVESEEGVGSCFYINIQLPHQTQRSIVEKYALNKNIFIHDTRSSNCVNLSEQLKAAGANVTYSYMLDKSLDIIKNSKEVDVLILDSRSVFADDVLMKNLLIELSLVKKVILLVNPKDLSKHSGLIKEFGVEYYLVKPVKRKELYATLEMSIHHEHEKPITDKKEESKPVEVTPKHILLVEDNPDNRMLIKAYLKKTQHTLDEAENGSLAVEMFKQNKYDVVLMDVQMPVMDGHEATRQIRDWESKQNKERTSVIALTAHAIKEEVDKCMQAGCDMHMSKPVKKSILLQTIDELE